MSSAPSGAGSGAPAPVVTSTAKVGHVHNLALDGERLLIGTHEGLWEQRPGAAPSLLSKPPFDVMGLAVAGTRLLASGHPDEGQDAPADLGLIASDDGGRSWQTVSLGGAVDFHRLVAVGPVVLGVSAHDGKLLRSRDAGATWQELGRPPVFDLAVDPADATRVVITTKDGPQLSTDGGTRFAPIPGAPLLAFLTWTPSGLVALAPDGAVHSSTDAGRTWTRRGSVGGEPGALAADGARLVALVGHTVVESRDGGASFAPRLVLHTE
ncbi:MAG: exo-alpha-sialidase [Kineosporiaceae bacterium]|nr:exo-alpha-sialidase [Kineosporiaceae bacterium]